MLAGIVLFALVMAAGTLGRTGWLGPLVLAALSVAWFEVNKSMEGEVLWIVTPGRGLTSADFAGLAGLVLAAGRVIALVRRSPRRRKA